MLENDVVRRSRTGTLLLFASRHVRLGFHGILLSGFAIGLTMSPLSIRPSHSSWSSWHPPFASTGKQAASQSEDARPLNGQGPEIIVGR